MTDYKDTLNLPKTELPMKANLKVREAEILSAWKEDNLYGKIREKSQGKKKYTFHDGPPYANGNIHIGTALNKILKDFVVRIKTMEGYDTPFVPGWDCHGLPIEHQVEKELGKKKHDFTKDQIRKLCREYAGKYVSIQRDQFERLGVLADWQNPYLTMNYSYEASIVRELGKFMDNGGLYKGLKPIHWCCSCRTALAEAEVEHQDHTSPSIYVKFPLNTEKITDKSLFSEGTIPHIVIWTTTPWTLPANLAVSVHPDFDYSIVVLGKDSLIIASDLVEAVMQALETDEYKVTGTIKGEKLEGLTYSHPLNNKECPVILGKHVTLEQGTGCVHTAPGHGQDDFIVGQKYGLDTYNPVDDNGKFIQEIPLFGGMKVFEANSHINTRLSELNLLLKEGKITHSYPHCWRCRKPIIFRATAQWFISMEKNSLREKALKEIKEKEWIPSWGKERIYNMVENRPDWCVSRQRAWGVPITAFYCKSCSQITMSKEIADFIADQVDKEGADIWFTKSSAELLPPGTSCGECGKTDFEKETDILDVWFDSGVSHSAVLAADENLSWPADLYLEGSDQHRGWFHSSLLESVATRGCAPYKTVLTHGYVVDGKGKKMSKSSGNVIAPQKVIDRYGADLLRLWVASENYKEDVRISDEILRRLTDAYRKMRNTFRFLLGNLNDFSYQKDKVSYEQLTEIDRYILHRLQELTKKVKEGYDQYDYHIFYHSFYNFCTVDLSAFYLDIIKDRLYTFKDDSHGRRSAQTTLYTILDTMLRLAAPILPFTTTEVWNYFSKIDDTLPKNIHLTEFPVLDNAMIDKELSENWERILLIRGEVSKALETARRDKMIGHSLDAQVSLYAKEEIKELLEQYKEELNYIFIVSQTFLTEIPLTEGLVLYQSEEISGLEIAITTAEGDKCERCWNYSPSVGTDSSHPTLCERCQTNINY